MLNVSTTDNISIKVQGKLFKFSIKKLRAESKYFEGMFSGNFVESKKQTIELHEVKSDEFQAFAKWLNSTENYFQAISREALVQLLFISDRFMVERLYSECIDDIRRRLKLSKGFFPAFYLEVAVELSHTELKEVFRDWFTSTLLDYPCVFNYNSCKKSCESILKFTTSQEYNRLHGSLSIEAYNTVETWITEVFDNLKCEWEKVTNRMREHTNEFRKVTNPNLEQMIDYMWEGDKLKGTTPLPSRTAWRKRILARQTN